jgi:hypothetical protein
MTIFKEIHELRVIGSKPEFLELKRKLSEAISRGWVEQIEVMRPSRFSPNQEWYRDKETGEIYSLDPPGERGGWWDRVDPGELIESGRKVQ